MDDIISPESPSKPILYSCFDLDKNYASTNLIDYFEGSDLSDFCLSNCKCTIKYLFNISLIDSIDCSSNYITNIDDIIYSSNSYKDIFQYTEKINLSKNMINNIKEDLFENFKYLTNLDLSFNLISNIHPKSMDYFVKLEKLSLNENKISDLTWFLNLNNLRNIKTFEINNNQINSIDSIIFNAANLTYLDLSFNRLELIKENTFYGLVNLRILKLNNNFIRDIYDESFRTLTNLNNLDISFNNLTVVREKTFNGLNNLQDLSLRSNQINQVDLNAFSLLSSNLKVDLKNNPLDIKYIYLECESKYFLVF